MLQADDHARHEFRRLLCSHCGHPIDVPIQCSDRFCWMCSRIRAAKIRKRLRWILSNLHNRAGYFPAMITLSIQNDKNLERQTARLIASFRRLRQTEEWRSHVAGGATIIEIKKGVEGWHAHIHAFVYMRYYRFARVLRSWKKASGGTAVFITRASESAMMNYVTKYVCKTELNEEDRMDASSVLKRFRLFQRFGDWTELKVPKTLSDAQCDNCGKSGWFYIRQDQVAVGYRTVPLDPTHSPPF